MRRLWLALTLAVAVIPSAGVAQEGEILLERVRGTGEPTPCDWWHVISCDYLHFDGFEETASGTVVRFSGKPYELLWRGNGYYLDSGATVVPEDGAADITLAGQRWMEIRPGRGPVLVSEGWHDVDADGLLGPGDKLVLAGGEERTVKDVRLSFRIKPLGAGR